RTSGVSSSHLSSRDFSNASIVETEIELSSLCDAASATVEGSVGSRSNSRIAACDSVNRKYRAVIGSLTTTKDLPCCCCGENSRPERSCVRGNVWSTLRPRDNKTLRQNRPQGQTSFTPSFRHSRLENLWAPA